MVDVPLIIDAIKAGDPDVPAQLLPLVYDELRRLASHRLAHQPPGQTSPTSLLVFVANAIALVRVLAPCHAPNNPVVLATLSILRRVSAFMIRPLLNRCTLLSVLSLFLLTSHSASAAAQNSQHVLLIYAPKKRAICR